MAKMRKSWQEKLADSKSLPKVVEITDKMSQRWGTGTVVIPAPMEVNEIMKNVPRGKLVTIYQIREILAQRHSASIGCPITTGIFVSISAHAAGSGRRGKTKYYSLLADIEVRRRAQ